MRAVRESRILALLVWVAGCCFNDTRARAYRTCSESSQCGPTGRCEQGVCVATDAATDGDAADASIECPAGLSGCGASCVDLTNDPSNCGACGNVCDPVPGLCAASSCVCPAGLTPCGPSNACRDLQNDPTNCAACARPCGSREYCAAGACVCRPGLTNCPASGGCVDVSSHAFNCGGCRSSCGGGTAYCFEGACSATDCTLQSPSAIGCAPSNHSCVTPATMQSSPIDCGGCGNFCAVDQVCVSGACESFVFGLGCSSCPCPECAAPSRCCTYPGAPSVVICVTSGAACP